MIKRIVMPKLGLTATEGRIVKWLLPEGSKVVKGEPLFLVETEKSNVEIECPASGILLKVLPAGGGAILFGKVIGFIATEGEKSVPVELLESSELAAGVKPSPVDPAQDFTAAVAEGQAAVSSEIPSDKKVKASPLARKLAVERGVDLNKIIGTGPGGRVTKNDVLAAEACSENTLVPPATSSDGSGGSAEQHKTFQEKGVLSGKLVEQTRFGRIGAKRLTVSKQTVPHWYIKYDIDVSSLLELRQGLLTAIESQNGHRLTVTDMLVKAVAIALKKQPMVNASYQEPKICLYDEINIAVAVDTPNGLVVPVIRGADKMSLVEISSKLSMLSERAKAMKLTPEDVSGGTFTISNLGMFGATSFSAIIDPPQAGILAVGGIVKRPVVVGDTIAIRPIVSMTLSADHRVIDGGVGARFMKYLKELIENAYILMI